MRLLDLFCGAGGCAVGYHRAGFTEIVGVDNRPQPRYPFTFVQGDALDYLEAHGKEFDLIHASPPCQAYSRSLRHLAKPQPKLIDDVRYLLLRSLIPYVIENVLGSPLSSPVLLCGTMFDLPLRRHRLFESSLMLLTKTCRHRNTDMNPHRSESRARIGYAPERQYALGMGVEWMTKAEAREAIPPAYTEFIGRQIYRQIERS